MPLIEDRPTLHVPPICQRRVTLHPLLNEGGKIAILKTTDDLPLCDFEALTVDGCVIHVSSRLLEVGLDETWLATPLSEDVDCWVPFYGGTSWLPLALILQWLTAPVGSPMPAGKDTPYVRVAFGSERTFAELCCNAHCYAFDVESGMFQPTDKPQMNAVKSLLRNAVILRSGGTDDRIADYGRLLLFLLSKAALTEEERSVFADILPFAPKAAQLGDVVKREKSVQTLVSEAKKDPLGFLNWDSDWNNPWWQNKETA